MPEAHESQPDEDLTPHFHWRWGEHGIYLGVCSFIGLFVLTLHMLPTPAKRRFNPADFDFIQVRYIAAADQPPEDSFKEDPFRDPRLIHPARKQAQERIGRPKM
jgi:hypothetical protein